MRCFSILNFSFSIVSSEFYRCSSFTFKFIEMTRSRSFVKFSAKTLWSWDQSTMYASSCRRFSQTWAKLRAGCFCRGTDDEPSAYSRFSCSRMELSDFLTSLSQF